MSRTAVNSLIRQWADYLEPKGIAVIAVHRKPFSCCLQQWADHIVAGLVATRMGENLIDAISPAESAKGFVTAVQGIDMSKTGAGIYSYDGSVIPW
jgi:hypothetical protein